MKTIKLFVPTVAERVQKRSHSQPSIVVDADNRRSLDEAAFSSGSSRLADNCSSTGVANSQQVRALIGRLEAVVQQNYIRAPKLVRLNAEAQGLLRQVQSLSRLSNQLISGNAEIYSVLPKTLDRCTRGIDAATLLEDQHSREWTQVVLDIIANYSDSGEFFSRTIAAEVQGLVRWILELVSSKAIQADVSAHKNKEIQDIVTNCLMSLHNITKYPETWSVFHKLQSIEGVHFYLSCPDEILQCLAMIFTARIVEDAESVHLANDYGVASSFIKVLSGVLNDSSGRGNQPGELSAAEIADGMRLLLITDANKSKFVAEGVLPLLEKMLECGNGEEQFSTIQCLWTLAFSETERAKILESKSIMQHLEELTNSEAAKEIRLSGDKNLRLKAYNAFTFIRNGRSGLRKSVSAPLSLKDDELAAIDGGQKPASTEPQPENQPQQQPQSPPSAPCIFISYCQRQQSMVLRIREALGAANFECWIDCEQMHGSTLHCMANGIEKCTVALICYSEDYKKSNNCRVEAEYIFQLRKPIVPVRLQKGYRPDGWLGIIIGARFYLDLSLSVTPFSEAMQKLGTELINQLRIIDQKAQSQTANNLTAVAAVAAPIASRPPSTSEMQAKPSKTATFASWSNEDVKKWLDEIPLASSVLGKLDGSLLWTLFQMKSQAPEAYYSTVSKFLGDTDLQLLLAHLAALDRLWQTAK